MNEKQRQLQRFKAIATGLLILMAAIYIACLKFLPSTTFTGYLSAFAEAAMVGALADWFAVTALFKHPLGLRIPHTNLIENSKKKIGDNLGNFITDNFLTPNTIRPRLQQLKLINGIMKWLDKPQNKILLTGELIKLSGSLLHRMDEKDIQALLTKGAVGLQEYIRLNELAGNGLEALVRNGYDRQFVTRIAALLKDFIEENHDIIREKVREESPALVPGIVDNLIAKKITKAAVDFIAQIHEDPDHKIRKDISDKLLELAIEMKTKTEWEERFKSMGRTVVTRDGIKNLSHQLLDYIKTGFNKAAADENSGLYKLVDKWIGDFTGDFIRDEVKRENAEKFIRLQLFRMILKHKHRVAELISQIVGDWKGRELSDKLELEVGKDLQYIRINGTLVGGTVGVLIHFLSAI